MIKTVIFDFDGTIADSLKTALKIYNQVAPTYALRPIQVPEAKRLRDLDAKELIKKFNVPPLKLLLLTNDVRSRLKKDVDNIPTIKGMDKLLAELDKNKVKVGIVTSNSKENVEVFLKRWHITNVDFIHSSKNLFGKDNVLRKIIKEQKLKKEECIYVGDEVRDVEASHKAGISVIAVTWGFNSEKRLSESQPNYLVSKPEEILEKIGLAN